jgi:uncharacterized protein (TIGR03067 family)
MRVAPSEFRACPLRVHTVLHDVPLEDVWAIRLPGGGPGRTIQDVRAVFIAGVDAAPPIVKGLPERDGNAADDVVGHRLSFTGSRFQIQSKDGKLLYAGTVRLDESAKPAAIDFEHTEGALKGKAWKGIYALDGDTLTMCDNAPNLDKGRPAAFEAKSGSGYVLITFKREKP